LSEVFQNFAPRGELGSGLASDFGLIRSGLFAVKTALEGFRIVIFCKSDRDHDNFLSCRHAILQARTHTKSSHVLIFCYLGGEI